MRILMKSAGSWRPVTRKQNRRYMTGITSPSVGFTGTWVFLNIVAVHEDGGDPVDMSVEDMKKEGLADLDFGRICPLTLYAEYQADPLTERGAKMYGYFSWGCSGKLF